MTGVVDVVVVALAGVALLLSSAGIVAANAADNDGDSSMVASDTVDNDDDLPDMGKDGKEFLIQQFALVALTTGVA